MQYVRLAEGLTKYKLIPASENIWDHIKTNEKDYYLSVFHYNDNHYAAWKSTGSVRGITDVTTNKLVFDFDNAMDIRAAQNDAAELVGRLLKNGIEENCVRVAYSGMKGFSVEVETDQTFTPEEFKETVLSLASGLSTLDKSVNDPQRIVRVLGTKHPKTNLYKLPINLKQLTELDINTIKQMASSLDSIDSNLLDSWAVAKFPTNLKVSKPQKEERLVQVHDLDLSKKPKWLSDAKYALQEGYFGSGERNTAFMVLAATYRNQGFSKEIIYRMLKGVAEIQASRNNVDRYSDEELYNKIVEVVCKPDWKGGTYSYENTPLLQDVTKRLGLKIPSREEVPLVPVSNVSSVFKKFATEIDKNTIKLGIESIDSEIRVTTSMLVGLLAAPSAGKSSVSMSILNTVSKSNLKSIFFSFDMGAPLVYQRLIQKHTGIGSRKLFDMYQNNDPKLVEYEKLVAENYKNVSFCFSAGATVEDMRQMILEEQERTGEKIKLVVVDYLESVPSQFSDPTASSAYVSQKLKDLANELELTVLLLLQTQKQGGDPSDELTSMRNIKGSSAIEQSCSIILTMNRPGFNPKNPKEDRFLSILVVKNRMGSLGSYDFKWDGLTGTISEMVEEDRRDLHELKKKKALEKAKSEL